MLTLTPLGKTIKGSHRWLDLGSFSFQPGELVKYTLCLSAIYFFNNYKRKVLSGRSYYKIYLSNQ